jgi:hypothetical protein
MFRKAVICVVLLLVAGCTAMMAPAPKQAALPDRYVVFFQPQTARLATEALAIVQRAADTAQKRKPSKIEIAVPPKIAGGPDVVEGRYTAIQNIFAASGANPALYSHVVLAPDGIDLPGGNDRAEIRLIP